MESKTVMGPRTLNPQEELLEELAECLESEGLDKDKDNDPDEDEDDDEEEGEDDDLGTC